MIEKIQKMLAEVADLHAQTAEEAEALRIKYLSKKGEITALMADFRNVPAELKKEVGMRINELKNAAQEKINALKEAAAEYDSNRDYMKEYLGEGLNQQMKADLLLLAVAEKENIACEGAEVH